MPALSGSPIPRWIEELTGGGADCTVKCVGRRESARRGGPVLADRTPIAPL